MALCDRTPAPAKAAPNNYRIDRVSGTPSVIARSPCDEATQGPQHARRQQPRRSYCGPFADKQQTASMLISQGSICHTRESGYPGATMRPRKSGPFVGAERVRLRERRGLLDSRVRGNDTRGIRGFIPRGRPKAGANSHVQNRYSTFHARRII